MDPSRKQCGASLVEYALLLALISLIGMASVDVFGQAVSQRFSSMSNSIDGVGGVKGGGCVDPASPNCFGPAQQNGSL